MLLIAIMSKAQTALNIENHSLNFKSFSLLNLTKTNIRLESQYSQQPQLYSASEATYTRVSLESGIIGFGFIPLKVQGFYSTENQNRYHENYLRFSFDLDLLIQDQKNKAQQKLDQQNRKLLYYKRDFENQKNGLKSIFKFNDSMINALQSQIKSKLKDTLSNLKNKITTGVQDSLKTYKSKIKIPPIPNQKDLDLKKQKYQDKYNDSLQKIAKNKQWHQADSLLKEVEKIKTDSKKYKNQLIVMQDSIKKLETEIKTLIEIIKNPKAKIQEMVGKKVKLPKSIQIGRINPFFSESVFNGVPAKGILVEFGNDSVSTTISLGKLSTIPEPNMNQSNFKSEYLAFKQRRSTKYFTYDLGLFSCYKNVIQGNTVYVIPFTNFNYTTKNGVALGGEFAKSFDYSMTRIENTPQSTLNSGYVANFSLQIPLSPHAGIKLLTDKSSDNYRSPGNPYFIAGPLKLQVEYYQSIFKDKLKINAGIRNTFSKNNIRSFHTQTFTLRMNSNFSKGANFSLSYLPIQTRSEFYYIQTQVYQIQTNVLNLMATHKKRVKRYSIIQNLGFWTKAQDGLVPDFISRNYFYSINVANSKKNRASLNYNFGKGHSNNDSLNQLSLKLLVDYGLTKKSILTMNLGYAKANYYISQHQYLVGIKRNLGFGMIWLESGGQKSKNSQLSYIGRLCMNFSF